MGVTLKQWLKQAEKVLLAFFLFGMLAFGCSRTCSDAHKLNKQTEKLINERKEIR